MPSVTGTPPQALTPPDYRLSNSFDEWPTWDYPSLHDVYCTADYRITGERNYLIGAVYIAHYLLYLSLYIPSLVVISRPPLAQHACYKLMLAVGVLDNCVGFFDGLTAGVLSIVGANYCDHTMALIVIGHAFHGKSPVSIN